MNVRSLFCLLLALASVNALDALHASKRTMRSALDNRAEDARQYSPEVAESEAEALLQQGLMAMEEGRKGAALGFFNDIIDDFPRSQVAPSAYLFRGDVLASQHRFEKAYEAYVAIFRRYPDFERFNDTAARMFTLGERIVSGERPYYWGIIPGFRDYEDGVLVFEAIVQYAPYSDSAPEALMNIARLWQIEDEPEQSIDALDRLINRYPRSLLTPEAYLKLADTYMGFVSGPAYDQEATQEAISYLEDYLILYPETEGAVEAQSRLYYLRDTLARSKFELGEFFYYYRNLHEAALVFLNAAITIDPQSPTADEARELIARIEAGEDAPKTPVDIVFGRYQHPRQMIIGEGTESENAEDE